MVGQTAHVSDSAHYPTGLPRLPGIVPIAIPINIMIAFRVVQKAIGVVWNEIVCYPIVVFLETYFARPLSMPPELHHEQINRALGKEKACVAPKNKRACPYSLLIHLDPKKPRIGVEFE